MSVGVDVVKHVGLIELQDPPHNFLTAEMVRGVADALEAFDRDREVRAAVLCAQGRSFCGGVNLGGDRTVGGWQDLGASGLYAQGARLLDVGLPVVAAVHGSAVGGGLGLAMACSLRVTCPEARFSANFVRLGVHHGFGLSVTLPALVGPAKAALVLLTGRRFGGVEAAQLGLADFCVPQERVRDRAVDLAQEIASGAPLAIRSINRTLRAPVAAEFREATRHEEEEQAKLFATQDFAEGVKAYAERRDGRFSGV